MALARPGTARGSGRPLGRLLPAAAFGLFCFVLGTRLSPAVKQAVSARYSALPCLASRWLAACW